ncbi:response regulator receiver modulated diguanylate phosphodiesterase [Paraglaciecola mesophila KMM 241]|uniref:Response regulator receiver modulated diguanylate phosphodiesterase n=1 Tax=Paraglaciecola mesophila KMM 241 TaxID=1128912 RepID=K6YR28_9ALTE|nr:EAL domain-containing protein [Paraglaciecola mesophila]GAC26426.1 response regulator receiver modulated diguanylate phosphodiesterase [Paraglaciecola mesophila KMM 241]|tara:strand:- start:3486 stop:5177 length:1692 start_codon:yes stop_codon:yes gene_type:complete
MNSQQLHATPATGKLLVVDDEPNILSSLKRCLVKTPFEVFMANSAQEGLAIMQEHKIQVVLSDFRMPQMSGAEFLEQIKQHHPDVISMVLSGFADFDSAIGLLNSGAAHKFLRKPWNNQQLIEEVDGAFVEYHARKMNRRVLEGEHNPEYYAFEQAVRDQFEMQQEFCLVSLKIKDYDYLEQHAGPGIFTGLLTEIRGLVSSELPQGSKTFAFDSGKIFIIIPDFESEEVIRRRLSAINHKLNEPNTQRKGCVKINCVMGYALAPTDGEDPSSLMENLRCAFSVDNSDRERLCRFDSALRDLQQRQLKIKNSINGALRDNQFFLHFQPKVHLPDQQIDSAEILIRWQHNELGWIPPNEFINLSELDGQIEQIGEWLIDQSVKKIAELHHFTPDIKRVAINISSRQLANHSVVEQFEHLLDKYALPPSLIELEITESCLIQDFEQTLAILWELKELGVSIAMDDFGTGYSSFAYLAKLPIDVLKLDKVLVDGIEGCKEIQSMIGGLIAMCHELGIDVVAEGVELEGQVALLKQLNCDYIQGYYFSKALPKPEFEKLLLQQPFMH